MMLPSLMNLKTPSYTKPKPSSAANMSDMFPDAHNSCESIESLMTDPYEADDSAYGAPANDVTSFDMPPRG